MNKWEVLQAYWERFGLLVFNEQTVPSHIPNERGEMVPLVPPYITYEPVIGSLDGVIQGSAKVWYHGTSNTPVTDKITEMEPMINTIMDFDGGKLKVRKPDEWARQAPADPTDEQTRAIIVNVLYEFLSL